MGEEGGGRVVRGARDGGGGHKSLGGMRGMGGTVVAQQNIDGGRGIECGEFLVKAKATEGGWWNGQGGRWVGEGFQ